MDKARVFLSWSGERSKKVATLLSDWLPDVLQGVEPFMSDTDIAAGEVWFEQIGNNLASSRFAIMLITPENLNSNWLHFEAGAIGMTRAEGARGAVAPYLIGGLTPTDLRPPLSLFQGVQADEAGTLSLVKALNDQLPTPMDAERLRRAFKNWWSSLDTALSLVPAPEDVTSRPAERTDRELLEEMLVLLRDQTAADRGVPSIATPWSSEDRKVAEGDRGHVYATAQMLREEFGLSQSDFTLRRVAGDSFRLTFLGLERPRSFKDAIAARALQLLGGGAEISVSDEPF